MFLSFLSALTPFAANKKISGSNEMSIMNEMMCY